MEATTNKVRKNSLINFYGTEHKVDSVEEDRVKVTMGNGIQLTLWWTNRAGCEVIKY